MLISISLTYKDINAYTPELRYVRHKRRLKPNRKRPRPTQRLKVLRKERANVRAKIKHRLDAITFRLGDQKKIPLKRSEAMRLKSRYDMLTRQIAMITKTQKIARAKK